MSYAKMLIDLEKEHMRKDIPSFSIGDTLKVKQRISEGGKERTQTFEGIVIARSGCSIGETFTMYRIAFHEGMERTFLLHNPCIIDIKVLRKGKVRRAKLYYLRGKFGKSARVKEKITTAKA